MFPPFLSPPMTAPLVRLVLLVLLVPVAGACGPSTDGGADTTAAVGAHHSAVVYGIDDRTEVYAHPSATFRSVAESVVAMELSSSLLDMSDPADVRIAYTRTLSEAKNLCAGERFEDQIEPGTCSGTLVGPRHLMTAGHCVDEARDCDGRRAWVFGFRYVSEGTLGTLTADDVYRCQRVLAYRDSGGTDHAVVELDRDVAGRTPVTIAPAPASVGSRVTLIGHPNGIPMKIAGGGEVTTASGDGERLRATVDAFNANSGSGVFDEQGRLTAVLTAGMDDYVDAGGCNRVQVIDPPPADDGENLTRVETVLDAFCDVPGVDAPVCGCDGICVSPNAGDTCATAEVLDLSSGEHSRSASLRGFLHDTRGSCGGAGPDRVYLFTVEQAGLFTAQTGGTDTVVYLRRGCEGTELACHDDIDTDTDRGSRIQADLDAGTYALFIDGFGLEAGDFNLLVSFEPGEMGMDAGVGARDLGTSEPSDAGMVPNRDGGAIGLGDAGREVDTGGGCSAVGPGGTGGHAPSGPFALGLVALGWLVLRRV